MKLAKKKRGRANRAASRFFLKIIQPQSQNKKIRSDALERTICAEGAHASRGRFRIFAFSHFRIFALTACGLLQTDLIGVSPFNCVTPKNDTFQNNFAP
jgi:hypothetical protein